MNAPHPGRPARGRLPGPPVRRLARARPAAPSTSCHPYAGDALPDPRRRTTACVVLGGAMGANDDDDARLARPGQGADPRRRRRGRPDARHLPGPPADRASALGGRVDAQPARPAGRPAPTSAGPTRPPATRCFGGLATPRRGVQWNDDVVTELPAGAVVLAQTPRRRGPGRPVRADVPGASSCTRRSTTTDRRPWVPTPSAASSPSRGLDADALLAEIEAARDELDARVARRWPRASPTWRWDQRRRTWRPDVPDARPATSEGQPAAARLPRPRALARQRSTPARRARPSRWSRCSAAPPTPTSRWPALVAAAPSAGRRAGRGCSRRSSTTRAPRCGCCRSSAPARRWPTTWSGTPSTGASSPTRRWARTRPAAYAVRAGLLARGRRRPATPTPRSRRCRTREAVDALRVEYRRLLLRLAARDLAHHLGVDDVAAELSDLAAGTLDAALAVARAAGRGGRPRWPGSP